MKRKEKQWIITIGIGCFENGKFKQLGNRLFDEVEWPTISKDLLNFVIQEMWMNYNRKQTYENLKKIFEGK